MKTTEQFGSACSFEDIVIGMAYNQKAMYKDAIFVLEKRGEISKNNSRLIAELGYAYALSGQTDKAQQMIKELNELGMSRQGHPYYYLSAIIQSAFGDKDEALKLLKKAYEHRDWIFPWIKVDQRLDPLRSDPRFDQITKRLKF